MPAGLSLPAPTPLPSHEHPGRLPPPRPLQAQVGWASSWPGGACSRFVYLTSFSPSHTRSECKPPILLPRMSPPSPHCCCFLSPSLPCPPPVRGPSRLLCPHSFAHVASRGQTLEARSVDTQVRFCCRLMEAPRVHYRCDLERRSGLPGPSYVSARECKHPRFQSDIHMYATPAPSSYFWNGEGKTLPAYDELLLCGVPAGCGSRAGGPAKRRPSFHRLAWPL